MPSEYANELMGRVGLDTTEWKKGITELNAGIKHIETGFQATAALMDDWSHSSDGLKARVDSLNDKLALQKQKLDILKKAYEEEVAANGASSKAAEELAKKMYAAKTDIEKTKESLDKYAKAEQEVTDQTKKMIAQIEKSGEKMISTGEKISSVGNKMTVGITAPVLAAGTAIYKYGSDLTEAENKTRATFGYMSKEVEEWAQTSIESFGMAKSTAYDAAALYGDMATSMKIPKSAAAEMSMKLVELSADLSSFKNISLEQSQNALKGIFTGETESLKNLGIVMTETQLKAYAMAQGFEKSYSDMTQAEKVQLRYQYVLESSKNAIGDYSRTNGEAAAQMRELPEALKETAAAFNDNVAPAITPVIKIVNNAIVSFGKLDDSTKETIVKIAALAATIGPLVTVGGKVVTLAGKMQKGYALLRTALLKKTQATVADTAAEGKHAAALSKTSTKTDSATKKLKNMGSSLKYVGTVLAGAGLALSEFSGSIEKFEARINKHYDEEIEKSNSVYDNQITNFEKEIEANDLALTEEEDRTNKYYDNKIDKLDDELRAQTKAIEKEKELYQKAHESRMEQLEAERDLKLSNIDIEANAQIEVLQSQISALDALTEAEKKEEEKRENNRKLAELQLAIDSAETYAEKFDAEQEYNDFVRQLKQDEVKEKRELEKEALTKQIENINTEAEKRRTKIDDEYEAAKKLEEDKNELAQQGFSARLEKLDTYIEDQTKIYDKLRSEELEKEKQHTADLNSELRKRINDLIIFKNDALYTLEKKKKEEKVEEKSWIERALIAYSSDYKPISGGKTPKNARGTNYWRGGLTRVNEEGGEIMNLPRGTQIIPHDVSMEMARAAGRASVTNNSTSTTNNSYNYGAQQQVNVFSIGGKVIAKEITPNVSVRLSDDLYRRRRSGGH